MDLKNTYLAKFDGDINTVTGDAKIFKEQVDQLRATEMVEF